jgi:hypothetical protein
VQTESYSEEHLELLNLPGRAIEQSLDKLNEMLANISTTAGLISGC